MSREQLLRSLKGSVSDSVLAALNAVPRELFVPDDLRDQAYEDTPLPIGCRQTISAPHMVAIMSDLLEIGPGMTILEIGGGSGYHAAVMAVLAGPQGHVYSVERIPELVAAARRNLLRAGIANVTVIEGDGSLGLPEHAPYDRISVAAAAPGIPQALKEQLRKDGRMVIPVGSDFQRLVLVTRKNGFTVEERMGVIFVPLIGEQGYKERTERAEP